MSLFSAVICFGDMGSHKGFYMHTDEWWVIISIFMKSTSIFYSALLSFFKSMRPRSGNVKTVPEVDINRYMGRWYEISSYPQWYEKGLSGVSAFYTLKKDYVEVCNSGYKNGKIQEAHGIARIVEGSAGAKLKVSFFRPFYGKYWIVDLAKDYSWVVVSNPNRSTLWIMCRTKTMDMSLYQTILGKLKTGGFDISKLVVMKQD